MDSGGSSALPGTSEVDISGEGRGSKRLITDTRDNVLASSANAVMSSEDILTEILILLPAFSLLLQKSVSKLWLSVITCSTFTLRHSQMSNIDPPSGLFVCKSINLSKSKRNKFKYDFISFDIRVPSKKLIVFTFGSKEPAKILQSCNGLLLCHVNPDKYFVYNPCLNMFKMLPEPLTSKLKPSSFIGGIRLVFDPTKSPHYKVVHARIVSGGIQIETYSSETCHWSVCADQISSYRGFNYFEDGIYWNGGIHWIGYVGGLSKHSRLDIILDHLVLTTIRFPVMVDSDLCCNHKLYESRGCLLFAHKANPHSLELRIFEMRNMSSGWSLKYIVNLGDLLMPSPSSWGIDSSAWCIVLGEREEDSFMVIESHGKVLQYKILPNTVHTLCEFGSTSPRESFPLIASFASV